MSSFSAEAAILEESAGEGDLPDEPRPAPERLTIGLTFLSLGVAAFTFWREAETEPYHIDELRQVRPYARGLDLLITRSFEQEQPPLDVIVGARFQDVLGVGDVLQRSHSMLAGLLALGVMAVLLWRSRIRAGIPAAVLLLAILPGFVSFTAYARPYALPLALMVGFALAADLWLEHGHRVAAVAITVIALLLPLSRVFEPPAFLVFSSLVILWFGRRRTAWGRRVWWPVGSAGLALLAVEVPVYLKLQERLTAYQGESSATLAEQWRRVIDDSIPRLAEMFVNGWLALLIVIVALASPGVLRRLSSIWWFWPLLLTALSFAVAFHIRTQPNQPFYDRYGYYWLPLFAVLVAVFVQEASDRKAAGSWRQWVPAIVLVPFVVLSVVGLRDDFTSSSQADFRSLGAEIEARIPPTTAVIYDMFARPAGSYRPGFAGYGRYASPQRAFIEVENLPGQSDRVASGDSYVIAANGPVIAVPGWSAVTTSETMTLYLPDGDRSGPEQLAEDLAAFGGRLEPRFGAVLRIGAASMLFSTGETTKACISLELLLQDDRSLERFVSDSFVSTDFADDVASCDLAE